MFTRGIVAPAAAVLALLTAACGGAPASPHAPANRPAAKTAQAPAPKSATPPSTTQPSKHLRPLTFQLEWRVSAQHVGFIEAFARGYYKQAGLDVKIVQGKGSGVTLQMIGGGDAPVGGSDAVTAAFGITKGVPVKVIGAILQESPSAFLYHKSLDFKNLSSLRGKTLISAPGDTNLRLLPAVLNKYHTSVKALGAHVDLLSPRAEYAAFLTNRNAVYLGYITNTFANLRQKDPGVQYKSYSSYGISVLGTSLIASDKEIQAHPGVLRAFMSASTKGWAYTEAHPRRAVAQTVKLYPNTKPRLLLAALRATLKLMHTPATRGRPFGWMARADWRQTIDLMQRYMGLKHPKPLGDYYTNAFIAAKGA